MRDEIIARVTAYRQKLKGSFPASLDRRVALLQLIRCYDFHRIIGQSVSGNSDDSRVAANYHTVENHFIWGLNEALSLMWADSVQSPGIPLFTSDDELIKWGNSFLICSSRIRLIEHVLELERLNLAQIKPMSEGVAHCYLNCAGLGSESIEREDFYFQSTLVEQDYKKRQLWERLEERRPNVIKKMEKLVAPFHKHYIRYDADPEVDEYYSEYARAMALKCFGWDTFAPTARFGGIEFRQYLEAAIMVMGFAKKHVAFCQILWKKYPDISPMNILSIPGKWSDGCKYLSYALDSSLTEAEQILSTTAIGPENVEHHLSVPASAPALHYLIGNGSSVRLVTGCLNDPFTFMLRELRRRFKKDWDNSVDDREHMFRNLLIAAFAPFGHIIFFGDNIQISSDAGDTDIDAFAFDPKVGVAAVFQLKWQDPFGSSMRERESRKTNFLNTGNAWVKKVCRWIEQGKLPQTISSLGMPKEIAQNLKDIRIFVLGRHFSHFSGECHMDDRAAWGTLPQLLRLLQSKAKGISPIAILHDLMKADSPHNRLPVALEGEDREDEIKIDGFKLVIHQPRIKRGT